MVGKGNGHLAPRFPPTRQPIPPHNDPQLSLALPGVLEVRNNEIKGKYIVKKVLQGPLRKDRDPICVHGNLSMLPKNGREKRCVWDAAF